MKTFSVIIPSYESQKTILTCLASLASQTFAGRFEIIVVHSSTDDVPQLISANYPDVLVVTTKGRCYPGEARNYGLDIATGEFVAFIDAHNEVPKTWLEDLHRCFTDHPQFDGIGGSRVMREPGSLASRVQYDVEFMDFVPSRPEKTVAFVPGGNSAFRRRAIGNLRFDPGLRAFEDVQFCAALTAMGSRIRFMPQVKVYYRARQSWSEVLPHIERIGYWSGIGRMRYSRLRGVSRAFQLRWAIALYRWLKLFYLTLRWEPARIMFYLGRTPLYFYALYVWARGLDAGIAFGKSNALKQEPRWSPKFT